MTTEAPIIAARAVHKTYRLGRISVPVLRGASMSVRPGECVAVLGASGSGKSTLLHLLGGLDRCDRNPSNPADDNRLDFEGRALSAFSASELDRFRNRTVGFVFQFYHLLPELNVLQNAMLPAMVGIGRVTWARQRSSVRAHAESLLERFGLSKRLAHRSVELSGGERQRVAIARALINRPRLLLADEPTGNLDANTGASILDALMELRRDMNQTMVIVTHDERVAARADRVVRINDGVVVDTPL